MFYILEKQDQLDKLGPFNDCYIEFIQHNDNYHPKLCDLSLIYIRDLAEHKGYMLCLDHNESFQLHWDNVEAWLLDNTHKLFVLDKKQALYHFPHEDKLFDVNFIKIIKPSTELPVIKHYYRSNYPAVNKLIPISKHYEKCELTFSSILPTIREFRADNAVYAFNNGPLTRVFQQIESTGIKIDKQCFIDCYGEDLQHPEYSISKGRIYSHYNLHTTTGRPSNSYNSINFAALNKTNGERLCYRPLNDMFIEFDIQGYHPRLIGELVDFHFPKEVSTYKYLGELLGVDAQAAKELTFKQLYGGVWKEYKDKPFFEDVVSYVNNIWEEFNKSSQIICKNKIFTPDNTEDINSYKLFNYIIQSYETSTNVIILERILDYLKNKQTKLVLYVYDSILLDYSELDGDQLTLDIKNIIHYPVNIKIGKNYHSLEKI
jgi:hypothetical protein